MGLEIELGFIVRVAVGLRVKARFMVYGYGYDLC